MRKKLSIISVATLLVCLSFFVIKEASAAKTMDIGSSSNDIILNVKGSVKAYGDITTSNGKICLAGTCQANWADITGSGGWTLNGTNLYSNNTVNVGIGNTSPAFKLDVNGDLKAYNTVFYTGEISTASDYPACTAPARIYTIGTLNGGASNYSNIEIEVIGSHRGYTSTSYVEKKKWTLWVGDKISSNLVESAGGYNYVGLWNGTDATGFSNATAAGTVLKLIVNPGCGAGLNYRVNIRYTSDLNITIPATRFDFVNHSVYSVSVPQSPFHVYGTTAFMPNGAGIGTATLGSDALSVVGNIAGNTALKITNSTANNWVSGNFGVGNASNASSKFGVFGNQSIGTGYFSTAAPVGGLIVEGSVGIGTTAPGGKLEVAAASGGWGKFVVNTTSQWGDGATQFVTIGAGGATGIMINNPHIVWNATNAGATIRMGRSGGVSTGAYYDIGTRASDAWSIQKNGSETGLFYIKADGNVGIGTTAPGYQLEVNGAANPRILVKSASATNVELNLTNSAGTWAIYNEGAGSTNDLRFYSTTATAGDKVTFKGNGNVGIGTASPGTTLEVAKTAGYNTDLIRVRDLSNSITAGLGIDGSGTYWGTSLFQNTNKVFTVESNYGLLVGSGYQGNNAPANGAIIEGNVGIGTTDPAGFKLNVNGTVNTGALTTNGNVIMQSGQFLITNGALYGVSSANSIYQVLPSDDNVAIQVYNGNATGRKALTLNATGGNVGIGTTNPIFSLQTNGTFAAGGPFVNSGGDASTFWLDSPGIGWHAPTAVIRKDSAVTTLIDTPVALAIYNANTTANTYSTLAFSTRETSSGNSIAVAGISGQQTQTWYGGGGKGDLILWTKNQWTMNEIMRLTAAGNVGIGTTAPATKLQVAGTITTTGLCFGSDCKASWDAAGALWSGSRNNNIWNGDAGVGNVGIGTAAPSAGLKLDVEGQAGATAFCDEGGNNCYSSAESTVVSVGGSISNFYPVFFPRKNSYGVGIGEFILSRSSVHENVTSQGAFYGEFKFGLYNWGNTADFLDFNIRSAGGTYGTTFVADPAVQCTGSALVLYLRGASTYYFKNTRDVSDPVVYLAGTSPTECGATVNYPVKAAASVVNIYGSATNYPIARSGNTGNYYIGQGSVGIGDVAPANKLSVVGDIAGSLGVRAAASASSNWLSGNTGIGNASIGASKLSVFGNQSIGTGYFSTAAPANGLIVEGSVGIGTTAPGVYKLNVSSTDYRVANFNSTYGQMNVDFSNSGVGFASIGSAISQSSDAGLLATDFGVGTLGSATNRIIFATGTGYNTRMLISANGNVGIGTTAPGAKLQVQGDFQSNGTTGYFRAITNNAAAADSTVLLAWLQGLASKAPQMRFMGPSASDFIDIGQDSNGSFVVEGTDIPRLVVQNAGNVGIGTTAPNRKLEVYTTGAGYSARFNSGGNYTDVYNDATWAEFNTNSLRYYIDKELQVDSGLIGTYNEDLQLRTSGTTRITVLNANGNVGIGTTNPLAKLEVSGAAALGNGTYQTLLIDGAGGQGALTINSVNSATHAYQTFAQGGVAKFEFGIVPTSGDFYLNNTTQVGSNNAALYILKSTGNVGIGTTNPNTKLQVAGSVNATGLCLSGDCKAAWSDITAGSATNVTALAGTWWGTNNFGSNKGATSYLAANNTYDLTAYSSDGGAAAMSFHRSGYYAVNFGLDPDNKMRIGGWSAGNNNVWTLDMSGNETLLGSLTAGGSLIAKSYNSNVSTGYGTAASPYYDSIFSHSVYPIVDIAVGNSGNSDNAAYLRFQVNSRSAGSTPVNALILAPDYATFNSSITASGSIIAGGGSSSNWASGNFGGGQSINANGSIYSYNSICVNNGSGACSGSGGVVLGLGNTSAGTNFPTSGNSFINNGSNFGVGITSPKGRLNTLALAPIANMTLGSATQPGLSVTASDGNPYGMYFGVNSDGNSWIQAGRTDSATAYNMSLQASGGTVGIGTASPSASKLTIDSNSNNVRIRYASGTRYRSDWNIDSAGSTTFNSYDDTGGAYKPITINASQTILGMNGSVGIGTASTNAKLHIAGAPAATTGALIYLRDTTAAVGTPSLGGIAFFSSPGSDYYVGKKNDSAGNAWLSFGNADTGSEAVAINSSGSVGIGTAATTAAKLTIAGDVTITGNLKINGAVVPPDNCPVLGGGTVYGNLTGDSNMCASTKSCAPYNGYMPTYGIIVNGNTAKRLSWSTCAEDVASSVIIFTNPGIYDSTTAFDTFRQSTVRSSAIPTAKIAAGNYTTKHIFNDYNYAEAFCNEFGLSHAPYWSHTANTSVSCIGYNGTWYDLATCSNWYSAIGCS